MLALLLMLSIAAPVQEQEPGPVDAVAILDELQIRTNALRSFRAAYRISKRGSPEASGRVDLLYVAPDRALARMSSDNESCATMWIIGSRIHLRSGAAADESLCCDADFEPWRRRQIDFEDLLLQRFPEARASYPRHDVARGYFAFEWARQGAGTDFSLTVAQVWTPERPLFSWLETLKQASAAPRFEDGRLVYALDGGMEIVISTSTGFFESFTGPSQEGGTGEIVLEELALDVPTRDEEWIVPECPPDARDATREILRQSPPPCPSRSTVMRAVGDALHSHARSWDERARDDWRAVAGELHVRIADWRWFGLLEEHRTMIAEFRGLFARVIREAGDDASGIDEVRRAAADKRSELVLALDESAAEHAASVEADTPPSYDDPWWPEFIEIERAAVPAAFDAVVRRPVLEEYDDAVRVLDGG